MNCFFMRTIMFFWIFFWGIAHGIPTPKEHALFALSHGDVQTFLMAMRTNTAVALSAEEEQHALSTLRRLYAENRDKLAQQTSWLDTILRKYLTVGCVGTGLFLSTAAAAGVLGHNIVLGAAERAKKTGDLALGGFIGGGIGAVKGTVEGAGTLGIGAIITTAAATGCYYLQRKFREQRGSAERTRIEIDYIKQALAILGEEVAK